MCAFHSTARAQPDGLVVLSGVSVPSFILGTLRLDGQPQSRSQTMIQEKTLDPVWGKPGAPGEEFYDKYAYEEGDSLEFIVHDYDRGCTDHDVLGRGKLMGTDFHKPGGFYGEITLKCPADCPKAYHEKPPKLTIKVAVNALEPLPENQDLSPADRGEFKRRETHHRFKAAVAASQMLKGHIVYGEGDEDHDHQ